MKKCRTCGRAVGEWKFCRFCGTPLDVTDLSYQKTGTLLRQNVVFSEDVLPQCETATATAQNNSSGQLKKPVATDIYSSSFETEKMHDETVSSKRQKPCKEISESVLPKEDPIAEKNAQIPVMSTEPTDVPEPQTNVIADHATENNIPNIEDELQTAIEAQEPEAPLDIGNLFGFASQAQFEPEGDESTEPKTHEELPESPSEDYLIQPADNAFAENVNNGFSQIDFDDFNTDDLLETDVEEDNSQINVTPIYDPEEPTNQEEPVFEPIEPIVPEEPIFEPVEPIAQEEPVFEPIEPIAQEDPVFEQVEPTVQEEPIFELVEPVMHEEPVFEPVEQVVQEEPFFEPIEAIAHEEPVFESVESVAQEDPILEPVEPIAQEKPPFESVGQAVPITKPAISVSEIDPMFGAAPSFDIESIKASFGVEKAGSKKKPKKGLFNRKE